MRSQDASRWLVYGLILFVAAVAATAQTGSGTIQGTVTDPTAR